MSEGKERLPADPFRAREQLGRFLGPDLSAPRDDWHLSGEEWLDLLDGERGRAPDLTGDRTVATIFYNDVEETVTVVWVGEPRLDQPQKAANPNPKK